MKSTVIWTGALFIFGVIGARLEGARVTGTVSERGPHHRVIQTQATVLNERGEPKTQHGRYVELATGLHYAREIAGGGVEWVDARPEFEVFPDGIVARTTQHKVILANDLHGQSAVEILTPDKKRLANSPRWLVYTGDKSGQSAIIAAVQACKANLVASNQVVYPSAFDTLKASLRYTLRLDGFEADVILHEQPPEPKDLGFTDADGEVYLEIWHEFFQAVPKRRVSMGPPDPATGQPVLKFEDTGEADTGSMQFGQGKAFQLDSGLGLANSLPVKRRWYSEKNRQFLIERVSYNQAREYLRQLPAAGRGARLQKIKTGELVARQPELAMAVKPGWDILAQAPAKPKDLAFVRLSEVMPASGFIIDYDIQGYFENYIFKASETYYVTDTVTLTGVTLMEGGSVLKFPPAYSGRLTINGPLHLETTPYRPVVCTAKDDDSIGAVLVESTGVITNTYGNYYIELNYQPPFKLKNLRIKHAFLGVHAQYAEVELHNVQFVDCAYAISAYYSQVHLRNALFSNVENGFLGNTDSEYQCQQVTFDAITGLLNSQSSVLSLVNCLLVNVAATNAYTGDHNVALASGSGVFATQAGGAHYLAENSSYRNAGSTNLNAELARDLQQLTTFAPQHLDDVTEDATLYPVVQRDTDTPDLGYHYASVDYLVSGCNIETGVTLTMADGASWAFYGTNGFTLNEGSRLVSEGRPFQPIHWSTYLAVQENYSGETNTSCRSFVVVSNAFDNPPSLQCRFTDISWLSANTNYKKLVHLNSQACLLTNVALRDSELWNVALTLQPSNTTTSMTLDINNCLLFRNNYILTMGTNGDASVLYANFRNNLFYGGATTLLAQTNGTRWSLFDNLFHSNELQCGVSLPANGYNGYLGTTAPTTNGTGNVTLSDMVYSRGPLGNFYQASTALQQQGSRSATNAGLYHYTVKPGNQKAGTNLVSIGLHYVACPNIWASTEGFADTQGSNQWYYYYASLSGQPTNQMPYYLYYAGTIPYWGGTTDFWAMVAREWQHPGSTLDSVRTFEVPANGEYRLYTQTRNDGVLGGDGVKQRILQGTNDVCNWWTVPGSKNDLPILHQGSFSQGDKLHFQVNCLSANYFDTTYWTQVIQAAPFDLTCDSDGDGIEDIWEDLNGNGVVDDGETDYQDAGDQGLRVWITRPKEGAVLP